jgi:transglutaminase-like putative cysteine protease
MHYKIIHTTRYIYNAPVSLCHNIARLIPRSTGKQTCRNTQVIIDPVPDVLNEYEDFFGNKVTYFAVQKEHTSLTVTVHSEIIKSAAPEIAFYSNISWEEVKRSLASTGREYADVLQYIPETPLTAADGEISAYARQSFHPGRSIFEATQELMRRIFTDFSFQPGFTTITTPLSTVMSARKGVCQDFAHLGIACLRSMGLPARYISGYIETLPPPGTKKLTGVDASHAWFSVFIPGTGWVDFDPTNNQFPGDHHLVIGWGRDYSDITPLKGVIVSSGPHRLSVSVDVRRLDPKGV